MSIYVYPPRQMYVSVPTVRHSKRVSDGKAAVPVYVASLIGAQFFFFYMFYYKVIYLYSSNCLV